MAAATATRTNWLTTTIPITAMACIAISPFHLATPQNTLLIDEVVTTISTLYFAVRADALCSRRWQDRPGLCNIIAQRFSYWIIAEDPLAMVTGESPVCHF